MQTHAIANGGIVPSNIDKMRAAMAEKRSKQVKIDGHMIDPIPAQRYRELEKLAKKGEISGLKVKPALALLVHGADGKKRTLAVKYKPLFSYKALDGTLVVEDVPHKQKSREGHLRDHWELQTGVPVKDVG